VSILPGNPKRQTLRETASVAGLGPMQARGELL
jgi:hypothetical protein